jgi:hypothetical protein
MESELPEPATPPGAENSALPQPPADLDYDEELILTYLTEYHALGQALMQAGFVRVGRTPGNAQPDWAGFARHIEQHFDPDSSEPLQGAVAYLLYQKDNLERRTERLQHSQPWETYSPHSDVIWLSEMLQQTHNRLIHGINFLGKPGCDSTQVMAALFIVEAWAHIDLDVEKHLPHTQ